MIGIGDIAESLGRLVDNARDGVAELLFEPVIRLGVTGLSRSGKTVFITSLVANLLNRGRMPQLQAASQGRIEAVFLQPQPDDAVPRFDYEGHLSDLTGSTPHWPQSTRSISQLRVSLRVRSGGLLSGLRGPRTVHLDIVDYPGEWLLDLPLLGLTYGQWSAASIAIARQQSRSSAAGEWLSVLMNADPAAKLDEGAAKAIASSFTCYLAASRAAGFSAVAPGRFLMPGDMAGSPALTFAPLEKPVRTLSNSLWRAFERRFEAYKRLVVQPFFRDHFAKVDRQIVLVDVLGALHSGPQAMGDLRQAMAEILQCFRPGQNGWLAPITGKRVERILFVATKADHLHHSQHARLSGLTKALLAEAQSRADFKGARTQAMSIAALRATSELVVQHQGHAVNMVRGVLAKTGKPASLHPGDMPEDATKLLDVARKGEQVWLDDGFALMEFLPPALNLTEGMGPPHIRLDRALEFLVGDKL